MPCRARKEVRIGPTGFKPPAGAKNRLGYEATKFFTMSLFYAFLSLYLKLYFPRRVDALMGLERGLDMALQG